MTSESDDPLDRRDQKSAKTLRLRSLSPALTVADVEASLEWYRDVVGFHVQEKWEQEGKVGGCRSHSWIGSPPPGPRRLGQRP